jgi:hypothetical protein
MSGSLKFQKVSQNPEHFVSDSSVEIIFSEKIQEGINFENALKGLDNIPLSPSFRLEVENDLRMPAYRALYKLDSPTIPVFTWPNGETRHFVISNSGVLLERDDFWLKYFPFIVRESSGYGVNIPPVRSEHIIASQEEFV